MLVIAGFLFSCSEKEEEDEKGAFLVDVTEYIIEQGVIEFSGQEGGGGYLFGIVLGTSGIVFSDGSVEGNGDAFYLRIYSENMDDVQPGSYTLDMEETSVPGTFRGHVYIGYNAVTRGITAYYVPVTGSLEIAKEGNKYLINVEFNCNQIGDNWTILESDIPVTCNYSGELLTFEEVLQ